MKLKDTKKMVIKPNINVDNTLGRLTREEYLINNPHGYGSNRKVHKNKKKYDRKRNKYDNK